MRFKSTRKPVQEIAKELHVDAVLEGTVTRDQGKVRITVQLIQAEPEKHLWAEKYEAKLTEVLGIQGAVASAVAHEIRVKVTPQEQELLAARRAVDPVAYESYLRGRYLWERTGEENLKRSRAFLESAISSDPGYAQAWAALADTYNALASWGVVPRNDSAPRARDAAQRAIELDGSLAGPLVALANVKRNYDWDWTGAELLYRRVISISPNYGEAHHSYATMLAEIGRMDEAVSEARSAAAAEPLSIEYGANVIWKLYLARRYREAEQVYLERLKWDPTLPGSYVMGSVYLAMGRRREAIDELQKSAKMFHGVLDLMYLAHGLGVTGDRAGARKVLDELLALKQQRNVPPEYLAIVYEGLGEREKALEWFEAAYTERSMNGWILPDQRLDEIRKEPRFRRIMQKMGLP